MTVESWLNGMQMNYLINNGKFGKLVNYPIQPLINKGFQYFIKLGKIGKFGKFLNKGGEKVQNLPK